MGVTAMGWQEGKVGKGNGTCKSSEGRWSLMGSAQWEEWGVAARVGRRGEWQERNLPFHLVSIWLHCLLA